MARAVVLRADARALPLPDDSVDLIVTSPPYYALRDYEDDGESLPGQIGKEDTPQEYIANLVDCTAEWMRVLKPSGSMFVNLGDKFVADNRGSGVDVKRGKAKYAPAGPAGYAGTGLARHKSLLQLPARYSIGCTDQLGLILRRDVIWSKKNPLPESATDRFRSSHEYLFHFVKEPRYYSAVDEVREPHEREWEPGANGGHARSVLGGTMAGLADAAPHPLGALPGIVWQLEDDNIWTIASEPLRLPEWLGVEHYAAFPTALPRKCILGWSPAAICTACGQGRFPVADRRFVLQPDVSAARNIDHGDIDASSGWGSVPRGSTLRAIAGYACACTPYTDYPERRRPTVTPGQMLGRGRQSNDVRAAQTGSRHHGNDWPERLPAREYHLQGWTAPPSRPAVVLDPFGGTGTTATVAVALGRHGISCDLGAGYSRAARWRTRDSAERAKARGEAKPPPAKRIKEDLYGVTDELDALLEESLLCAEAIGTARCGCPGPSAGSGSGVTRW